MVTDTLINKLTEVFDYELAKEITESNMLQFGTHFQEFKKEENINFIPIVLEGSLRVFSKDNNGNENIIYNINKYESCIIGLTSSVKNIDANLTAIANEDTTVLYIDPKNVKTWVNKYESWRNFMIDLYQKRLSELLNQHDVLANQRDEISNQHKSITDSIHYAKRIQSAALPPKQLIDKLLNDYFILFKPKDIVSGDYYWFGKLDNKVIIAAADCTGHGVPGAFMSMLGIAFMNEIVNSKKITHASDILNELRRQVKLSLRQNDFSVDSRDGMDIALLIVDFDNMTAHFSGANNPLYHISDGKLSVTKADRMPIGINYGLEKQFTTHKINLKKGDILYVFSDGYADQFGGQESKKFKSKALRKLLAENYMKSMSEQKQILDSTIEEWRGNDEQIDDILLIGVKI